MPFSRPPRHAVLRSAVAGAVAVGTVLFVAGCGLVWNTLSDGLVRDEPVTEVRLTGGSGDVTVIGDATVGVDVRRTVRYVGDARPGQTMSVSGGVLTISTECGRRCAASYEVRVAKGVKLTGRNDSGRVTARGVSDVDLDVDSGDIEIADATGSVTLHADSGRIEASDIGGGATLEADSGDVTVSRVAGPVSVIVHSGRVDVTGLTGDQVRVEANSGDVTVGLRRPANLTVRANSGNVTVSAPDRCCRIETGGDSGRQDIRVQPDPSSAYLLDLSTDSGDITVKPA